MSSLSCHNNLSVLLEKVHHSSIISTQIQHWLASSLLPEWEWEARLWSPCPPDDAAACHPPRRSWPSWPWTSWWRPPAWWTSSSACPSPWGRRSGSPGSTTTPGTPSWTLSEGRGRGWPSRPRLCFIHAYAVLFVRSSFVWMWDQWLDDQSRVNL